MSDLPYVQDTQQVVITDKSANEVSVTTVGQALVQNVPYYLSDNDKLFVLSSEPTTTLGTTETALLLFKNPSGSSKQAKIRRIEFSNFSTSDSFIKFRLYKSPTVTTNGTSITTSSLHIGGSAVAVITPFFLPVITANGIKLNAWNVGSYYHTLTLILNLDFELLLDNNNSLLITGQADGSNRSPVINIIWAEI